MPNVYYHLEWYTRISNSSGLVQIRINGVEQLNLSGLDTQLTSNNSVNGVVLYMWGGGGNTATQDVDDVVVRDDGWTGDKQVGCFFVTNTGNSTDWTPNNGTNPAAIDETAPDCDTTYNSSSTPGDKDTLQHQACSAHAEIDAVIPLLFVQKTDAGAAKIAPVIRHGGTDYTGADATPSASSYEYHAPEVFTENPGTSAAWTPSDFNAAEFGYERTE